MAKKAGEPLKQAMLIARHPSDKAKAVETLESLGYDVEEYGTVREFLLDMDRYAGGLVIAEFRLPEIGGLELASRLKDSKAFPIVLVCGGGDSPKCVSAGYPFCLKPVSEDSLRAAVLAAISDSYSEDIADRARWGFERMTPRAAEILALTAKGLSSREIGDRLQIARKTIEAYRAKLVYSTRAADLAELVRMWHKWKAAQ